MWEASYAHCLHQVTWELPDFLHGGLHFCACHHTCCGTSRALVHAATAADMGGRSPSTRLFRGLECNIDFNSVTSLRSWEVILTAAIAGDGVATSMIFSASWAKLSSFPVSSVEARTISTFISKHYRKSSCRKALSVSRALSTNSLCILLKNYDSFLFPNSSAWNNFHKRFCSEAVVNLISRSLSLS